MVVAETGENATKATVDFHEGHRLAVLQVLPPDKVVPALGYPPVTFVQNAEHSFQLLVQAGMIVSHNWCFEEH